MLPSAPTLNKEVVASLLAKTNGRDGLGMAAITAMGLESILEEPSLD